MNELLQDLRYALRMLSRGRGATLAAVLALGLGIGANTSIFSVVDAALLRPLPYPAEDRLVAVWGSNPARNVPFHNIRYYFAAEWMKEARSFELAAATSFAEWNMAPAAGDAGEPERLTVWRANTSFYTLTNAQLALGRGFTAEEDKLDAPRVVLLSHELWKRRFGARPDILNRTILLDDNPYTVVGVMQAGYFVPGRKLDAFCPMQAADTPTHPSANAATTVYARLKPGVTLAQAQAELTTIGQRIGQRLPDSEARRPVVFGWRAFLTRDIRQSLMVLLGAVALVLLIACANVANLLLAKATGRQREMAVRRAMGAGPGRILRQLFTESVVLACAGGTLGVLLAWWGMQGLLRLVPENYPLISAATLDYRVLLFTLGISLLTGLLFGLAPALASVRDSLNNVLKQGGRGGDSANRNRFRRLLVVTEAALAMMLLVGAGLLLRSFVKLRNVNPGFKAQGVIAASLNLPQSRYRARAPRNAFFDQLLTRLRATPGVQSAGLTTVTPLLRFNQGTGFYQEGRPFPKPGEEIIVWFRMTDAGYFQAMQIPLLAGRMFNDQDNEKGPPVALINQTLARRHWPNENPVGKRFVTGRPQPGTEPGWITVIGVVGDLKHQGLDKEPDAELFWPYRQPPFLPGVTLVVRTHSDAAAFTPQLRRAVFSVDPTVPVSQVRTMDQIVDSAVGRQRLVMTLLAIFAVAALALAAVGIYGVIAYAVERRTQEIGVRIALGAESSDVLGMVLRQSLTPVLAGIGVGVVAALALAFWLKSLLYGVEPYDPPIYVGLAAVLAGTAALASWIPARRAASLDPVVALRYE